eukprot:TRINITY_DN48727_c0_g1_i1.p1 TRINITY_DN48727_c0_g1~~TRINITY_DN48727_c0_g1_i1.p1  ORF type:complete len:270 (-),score=25.43 TRINITY_DN48727_c0_g1_i1:59-868(-)
MGCSSSSLGRVHENSHVQMRASWDGVVSTDLVVHALSGDPVIAQKAVNAHTSIMEIVQEIGDKTGAPLDQVQLCNGSSLLNPNFKIGQCIDPPRQEVLELSFIRLSGPAVAAEATSGRAITVLDRVPAVNANCHSDRDYKFKSLGDFANKAGMLYILTSNDDKNTPTNQVMWKLDVRVPVTVHLNFRSETHVTSTGVSDWLGQNGWKRSSMKSTVSTGHPNGPFSGPVYSKSVRHGELELMGSNCRNGTYFVFVEIHYGTNPEPALAWQ